MDSCTCTENINKLDKTLLPSQEEEDNLLEPPEYEEINFILYTRRWFILASYCMLSLVCGSSWLCFPAVSNILREYYNVNILAINMLSIVFCISLVLFTIPFAALLDKYGLALVMKISAFSNLFGSIIKYFGDDKEYGYWFLLCGNFFHSLSVAGYLFLPGNLASTWFGSREIGKATSICVAFDALGTGLGFLLATTLIVNNQDMAMVRTGIRTFLLAQMVPSLFVFLLICIFVKNRPPSPPNVVELNLRREELVMKHEKLQESLNLIIEQDGNIIVLDAVLMQANHYHTLMKSLKKLLKNSDFQLIFHMQGIVASIEGLFEILLNEMLVGIFPGMEREIGILGFVAVILGFSTNILVGTMLDKTGQYRRVSFFVFFLTTLLGVFWCIAIEMIHNFLVIAIILSLLMSTSTAYYTIAFAHSAKVAENVSHSATGVMLVLTSQIYDAITSFAGTELLETFGHKTVNVFAILLCLVATMLSLFVKNKRVESFV